MKHNKKGIIENNTTKRIISDSQEFPKYISFNSKQVKDIPAGCGIKDVLNTLACFSCKEDFIRKKPHPLEGCSDKIYSLDIHSRDCKYRLLYKHIEGNKYTIENLCTSETHKN